jgi:hypothetical protein
LEQISRNSEELSGEHTIEFKDLFTPEFMNKYTDYKSIGELLQSSGYTINSSEDIEKLPDMEWNEFIQKHTKFSNWKEMNQTALNEYFTRRLGLNSK